MYVCMYAFMYVCVRIYTKATHLLLSIHIHIPLYIYVYIYIYTHTYTHIEGEIGRYTSLCICTFAYMCTYSDIYLLFGPTAAVMYDACPVRV